MNNITITAPFSAPPVPGDIDRLSPYFDFIRRIRKEHNAIGLAIITTRIVIDAHGNPYLWLEPTVVNLEPRARAEGALRELVEQLTKE